MWAPWTPETGEGVTEVTWKVNIQVKKACCMVGERAGLGTTHFRTT